MSKSSTLLSSFSARLLMLDMRTSSYPRKLSRMNLERELPKHALLTGSRTSMWTGISSFCRVAGVSLRKPISRLYSTMYSSSGHTIFVSFSMSRSWMKKR